MRTIPKFVAVGSTRGYDVGDVAYDVVEAHVALLNFFGDETYVGLTLESTFKCDVACRAAHEFDEVPVFLGRVAVALDVADDFGVNLGGGVEAERCLDKVVLEVAVDSLRATDNLYARVLFLVVFGKDGGIGVGVVATDDYESADVEFAEDFEAFVELINLFEFGAA